MIACSTKQSCSSTSPSVAAWRRKTAGIFIYNSWAGIKKIQVHKENAVTHSKRMNCDSTTSNFDRHNVESMLIHVMDSVLNFGCVQGGADFTLHFSPFLFYFINSCLGTSLNHVLLRASFHTPATCLHDGDN